MLAIERRRLILDLIGREGRVLVASLSAQYGVSEETIRRDLQKLEREGRVSRAHGGAVLVSEPEELPYPTRRVANIAEKRRIAGLAAALVQDGDAVMIDSSSTAYELLAPLAQHRDLTVITNSVRILASSAAQFHSVISVGGELRQRTSTLSGPLAQENVARFGADICFISCKGLAGAQVSDPSQADADMKRAFIAAARRVCLLADGTKFGAGGLISVCDLAAIDVMVTDRDPGAEWRARFADHGVRLIF